MISRTLIIFFVIFAANVFGSRFYINFPQPVALEYIKIEGDLLKRVSMNFNRLEEEKYWPLNVYLTDKQSRGWPGDTEGRTILGLVLDAITTGRAPKYLDSILLILPTKLNEKGYMGTVYQNEMNEQQLSGNGWMLRGLCEYYIWEKDPKVLKYIQTISQNLFVAGKGYYSKYPIDPGLRKKEVGEMVGSNQGTTNGWMLSSDVGCLFIGMDGAIQAYSITKDPKLKEVIDEMIARFYQIDFVKVKAQTHATLTGLRGLIRFAEITDDFKYLEKVEKVWFLYKQYGMTENFENYNWFCRYDTWTEPCAIVDSYMIAVKLWQYTENLKYLEDAELIQYNAIAHTQHKNGGFGLDICPNSKQPFLNVKANEAHWCCTMRGAEGLSNMANNAYFIKSDTLIIPFLSTNTLNINDDIIIKQQTEYPQKGNVSFEIQKIDSKISCVNISFHSRFMKNPVLKINGQSGQVVIKNDFIILNRKLKANDKIELNFENVLRFENAINRENIGNHSRKVMFGPLVLGFESIKSISIDQYSTLSNNKDEFSIKSGVNKFILTPVYHLMDPKVWKDSGYQKQILFSNEISK